MTRPLVIMLLAVTVVLGAIFGWKFYSGEQASRAMAAMSMPPVTVSTAEARSAEWRPVIPAIGSLRALQGVDVTAQLAGQITDIYFRSGQTVRAGELLISQYTADDEARLDGLRADTALAEANLKRAEELVSKNLVSATDYDSRKTDLQRARAAEENLRLMIRQKKIRAPFSGRLGIREVDVGQYVEPGDPIVRLESFDQILVEFPVPQRYLGQLSVGQPIKVTNDAWPDEFFAGKISAIDPQVAKDTRALRVQGLIENSAERLLPGMYVEVDVELPTRDAVVTVPQAAITYSPYGDSVYVVSNEPDNNDTLLVRNTFIKTGATRGDQVAIEAGLEPGAIVVTSGQQKLRNGAQVRIDNSVPVSDAPDPMPANN
ncbi:MAG: efflux RND transporter periplasmic adaptor subunit [Gammaproteobacteria bacterium]